MLHREGRRAVVVAMSAGILSALGGCGDDLALAPATVAVRWSPTSLQLREGEQAQLELALEAPPSQALLLALRTPEGAKLQLESEPLVFSRADYATPRRVTVRALHDDDAEDQRATVGVEQADQLAAIDVVDDDELGVVFDRSAVSLSEAGSAQVGVSLAAKPPGEVRVELRSSDPAVLQVGAAELSFTPETWRVSQQVTVSSTADLDGEDEWVELRTGGPLAARVLPVQVIDRERQAILTDVTSVSMAEGFSRVVRVHLQTAPKAPVTVALAMADASIATVAPASLTFTRDNYTTPQRVTVQSLTDVDTVDGDTALMASAGPLTHSVGVQVIDQTVLSLVISPRSLAMAEGASAELAVQLSALPQSAITWACAPLDDSAVSIQPSTLTFQPQAWNVPQMISVTAIDDRDNVDELVSVVCSSPPLASRSATITITDDDPRFCGDGVCTIEEWESCACERDCEELGCPEAQ